MHPSILVDVVFDGSSYLDFSLLPPDGTPDTFLRVGGCKGPGLYNTIDACLYLVLVLTLLIAT
jgi:hypothetical protein